MGLRVRGLFLYTKAEVMDAFPLGFRVSGLKVRDVLASCKSVDFSCTPR